MVTIKGKTMVQYCIDAEYFIDALKNIPNSIAITNIAFSIGGRRITKKQSIPNRLKKLGITNVRSINASTYYRGSLKEMTKKNMIKTMKDICSQTKEDIGYVKVDYLTLQFANATAYFTATKKEIRPDESDLRKKIHVLGMTSSEGNVAKLLTELSAKKYSCQMLPTTTYHIICGEIK